MRHAKNGASMPSQSQELCEAARPKKRFCLPPIHPVLLGFCFIIAFRPSFLTHMGSSVPLYRDGAFQCLFYLASITAFAGIAIASRRGLSLRDNKTLLVASTAASTAGTVLALYAAALNPAEPYVTALLLVGTLLVALGSGVLTLAWYERLSVLSIDHAMLYYIASCFLAGIARTAFFYLETGVPTAPNVCTCLLPILACGCLIGSNRSVEAAGFATGEQTILRWSFPWQPVLLLGAFSLAMKTTFNLVDEEDKSLLFLAIVICYGILLASILLGFKRLPYTALRYIALPLMVAGMLGALNGPITAAGGLIATRIACELLEAFIISLLFDLAFRYGVNSLWVFGLVLGARDASRLAADLLAAGLPSSVFEAGGASAAISVLIILVIVAFMILASEANFKGTWGIGETGKTASPRSQEDDLSTLCAAAARLYELTRREEEVLLMRLQGNSLEEVREELCVSPNTVKTHVRHIYSKLGATNLEEARQIVELPHR